MTSKQTNRKRQTPQLEDFKTWAADNARLAEAMLLAEAFAACERERVEAYTRPIFDRYAFVYSSLFPEKAGQPLEAMKDLYLAADDAKGRSLLRGDRRRAPRARLQGAEKPLSGAHG